MYRSEFGLRDGHEKIHIISEHARAGQEDNPLEPIIQEAEADPDGKFIPYKARCRPREHSR